VILLLQHGPQSSWDQFQAFKAAISWSEPFILSLLCFHILMFVVNIFVMRSDNLVGRFLLIAFFVVVIRGAEVLNRYGSSNWEKFATQNYFDQNGVFVSLMLSAPLLLIAFIHLIVLLRESKNLLIEVKTLELKDKLKKKSKQSGDESAAATRSKKDN
jgi:transmembrane protein 18